MSILDFLNPVSGIATSIIGLISGIKNASSEEEKTRLTLELQEQTMQLQVALAQIKVNEVEAGSESLFKSGVRPMTMWICCVAFGWSYVLMPVITFICAAVGHPLTSLPVIDNSSMTEVLMGLLGLGVMRSYDKQVSNKD